MNQTKFKVFSSVFAFIFFLFLGFASSDPPPPPPPTPQPETTDTNFSEEDCYRLKNKCVNMFRERLPALIKVIQRIDKSEKQDNEKLLASIEGIAIMSALEEKAKKLKENCPSVHEEYEEEVGLILLKEVAKYSSQESQTNEY